MTYFTDVKKVDENRIEITKDIHVIGAKLTYDYDWLLNQEKAIKEDRDKYVAQREEELKEVAALIAECEKLGCKKKVVKDDIEVMK